MHPRSIGLDNVRLGAYIINNYQPVNMLLVIKSLVHASTFVFFPSGINHLKSLDVVFWHMQFVIHLYLYTHLKILILSHSYSE